MRRTPKTLLIVLSGKSYRGAEYRHRYSVFKNNLQIIHDLNEQYAIYGTKFAINQFADLTHEEFRARYLGFNLSLAAAPRQTSYSLPRVPRNQTW